MLDISAEESRSNQDKMMGSCKTPRNSLSMPWMRRSASSRPTMSVGPKTPMSKTTPPSPSPLLRSLASMSIEGYKLIISMFLHIHLRSTSSVFGFPCLLLVVVDEESRG